MLTRVERLIRLRKLLGLSQRELADEFKVSAGAIGSWEVDDKEIPGPVMKLIEVYEGALLCNFEKGGRRSDPALTILTDELVSTFANSTRITDADLLKRLRSSLPDYICEAAGETELQRKLMGLSLKRLVSTLGEAHGLPMKIAQFAAFLDPRIPSELREILASLQNSGRPMPFKTVLRIFQNEFGQTPDQMFAEFSRRPSAAASIGQVHRARLHDGTEVAVKLQYPDIREKCESNFKDLEFVNQLALLLGSEAIEVQHLLTDLQQTVLAECDYEQEALHQNEFAKIFDGDADIVVPKVIHSHSRKNILTSEWIEGLGWQEFKKTASQEQKNRAALIISKYNAQSTFIYGLLNADPHPGNYIFRDHQVAFVDYGRVKTLDIYDRVQLRRMHQLVLANDREQMKTFVENSDFFKLGPQFNFEQIWTYLTRSMQHLNQSLETSLSTDVIGEQRTLLKQLCKSTAVGARPGFFWPILFCHTMMISGRVDLGASGNWRETLIQNM